MDQPTIQQTIDYLKLWARGFEGHGPGEQDKRMLLRAASLLDRMEREIRHQSDCMIQARAMLNVQLAVEEETPEEDRLAPWSFTVPGGAVIEVTHKHLADAQVLVREGWRQTSRKYCTIARVPEGMTGIEALAEAEGRGGGTKAKGGILEWAERLGEDRAASQYMRVHARAPNQRVLDIASFAAFLRVGGRSA